MGYEVKMRHAASNVVFNLATNLAINAAVNAAVNVLLSVQHSRLRSSGAGRSLR